MGTKIDGCLLRVLSKRWVDRPKNLNYKVFYRRWYCNYFQCLRVEKSRASDKYTILWAKKSNMYEMCWYAVWACEELVKLREL